MGVVFEYLHNRKEKWLKSKQKNNMSDEQVAKLVDEAEAKFAIRNWIPDAAGRAKQISLASHVCKFSHPDAKASPIILPHRVKNDGYLHSGNIEYELDAFGNAAAMDVFDFLMTTLDGVTILSHLENDSEEIRTELAVLKDEYETIRRDFLAIKHETQMLKSDERIKQVYFPVGNQYHLLSLLTASGVLRVLQGRINEIREGIKAVRNTDSQQYGKPYDEIRDLTMISFGGTKPQNISVLNSRNFGKAYLLASYPPTISYRKVTRPRRDFFSNTLQLRRFKGDFEYLHALFQCDRNNLAIRNKIRATVDAIIDNVMNYVYGLRAIDVGWTKTQSYNQLSMAQKIWLDDVYAELRVNKEAWLDEISAAFARWIITTYGKVLKNDSIVLGDGEMVFLQSQIEMALLQDEESSL